MNTDPLKSATFCGCDEGAAYKCERHRYEQEITRETNPRVDGPPATQELTRPTNPQQEALR